MRRHLHLGVFLGLLPWFVACAGSAPHPKAPKPEPKPADASADADAGTPPSTPSATEPPAPPAADANADPLHVTVREPLPPELQAGVVTRAQLQAVLSRGIGYFLRDVRIEPQLHDGRFLGWRIASLFAGRADVHVPVLQPGDVVTRVNGQAVEHPEEFQTVWNQLATASEIVLDVDRDAHQSRVHFPIVE